MDPSLTFHGAAGSVTGSCTLLTYGDTRILVDCGTFQGGGYRSGAEEFAFDPASIDAVVLTHGHLDHCGRVPLLVHEGFAGPIYGQRATCAVAEVVWEDGVRLAGGAGASAARKAGDRLKPLAYQSPFAIGDVRLSLYDAGHILGSSHVLAEAGGRRVLFSGDIGAVNTPIVRDPHTEWPDRIDAVVIESTYGNRAHRERWDTIIQFQELVKKTVADRGVLLVPAFAIGRTQEMLYHLNSLVETKKLPRVPVFLDSPMAGTVTEIYTEHRDCYDALTRGQILLGDLPLDFRGLNFVESHEESRRIALERPPFIVIAGSGMCTGGRILRHLKTFLPHRRTTVMIVGYQGRGTLGRELVEGAQSVTIDGERVPAKATIETLNGFSAHADRDGLLEWASHIPGDTIRWYVNHGEEDAAGALARALTAQGRGEGVVVREGAVVESR